MLVLAAIIIGWLTTLTIFVIRMTRHYNRLTEGVTKTGLREVLDGMLSNQKELKENGNGLVTKIDHISSDNLHHIQHVGIVRFNPFSDTGGSQSFTLAFLDGHTSGIVMTSLYARTGNRWYVKEITEGKGKELALSKEEQLAIKKAVESGRT